MDLTSSGKLERLSASVQEKYRTKGFLCPNYKKAQAGFLSPPLLFVLTNSQLAAVWVDHYACHKAFFWHTAIQRSGSEVSKAEETEKDVTLTNDPCHLSGLSRNILNIHCFRKQPFHCFSFREDFFKIKIFVGAEKVENSSEEKILSTPKSICYILWFWVFLAGVTF